jgi:hypothetical protein
VRRVLLDHNVPEGVRGLLPGHDVALTREKGWSRLANGALLTAAERDGFEVFVTGDRNIRFQQTLAGRQLALVVLGTHVWPVVRNHGDRIAEAVDQVRPGAYLEVPIPLPPRPPRRPKGPRGQAG